MDMQFWRSLRCRGGLRILLLMSTFLWGCSSGVENYLAAPETSFGGPSKLTLAEAGIRRLFFTNRDGGVSVRDSDSEYELLPGGDPAFPVLSPGAVRVAAVRDGAMPSLEVVRADGSQQWVVRPDAGGRSLAWSGDGQRLLFATSEAPYDLYVVGPDLSSRQKLASSAVPIDAGWSPDGRQVVYTGAGAPGGMPELFVVDADGAGRGRVTSDGRAKSFPAWSPDGGRLAFVSFDTGGGGVFRLSLLDLERSQEVELAAEAALFDGTPVFTAPSWSPSGRFIGFSVRSAENLAQIEFIDTQDNSRREVTDGKFEDIPVAWAPRRGLLAFARRIENAWFLAQVRITQAGQEQFVLGPERWGGFAVEWR